MLCEHADRSRIAMGTRPNDLSGPLSECPAASKVQSRTGLLGWDELPGLVLVLDHCRELRPVRGQPVHRIRLVDAAIERIPGGIFERFLPQPRGGIIDQLMETLIARMRLESVGNPGA